MAEGHTAAAADAQDSADIVARLKLRMIEHCLPLWSTEGWDDERGRLYRSARSRRPRRSAAPRRVFVQARQIYCYAKAAQLGWYPDGRAIALKGLEHLLAKAKAPDGRPGFVHTLTPDGAVLDPLRDSYDHAFVLLALATVYALDRDAQIRAEIDALCHFIDTQLRSPHGGVHEGLPVSLPRRQNPHMHLFEAMIAAFDATHDLVFQNRAGNFFSLFLANLYDKQRQVLGEYFEEDFSKIEPVSVEPGHQAEWVWLLKGFERITGCPTGRYRGELLASALRYRDEATGCLVDEGNAERQHQAAYAAAVAADRNRQGVDRAGGSGRGGGRGRSARGAGAARTALSQPSRGGRLVRPVRSRRQLAGRHHPCVFVLPCALRGRGSGAGDRLSR